MTPLHGLLTKRMDVFMSLGFGLLLWMSSCENLEFQCKLVALHVGVLKNNMYADKTIENRYIIYTYIHMVHRQFVSPLSKLIL